jgi:hypothetical protein
MKYIFILYCLSLKKRVWKSIKERLLYEQAYLKFLESGCKGRNYFRNHKIKSEKNEIFSLFNFQMVLWFTFSQPCILFVISITNSFRLLWKGYKDTTINFIDKIFSVFLRILQPVRTKHNMAYYLKVGSPAKAMKEMVMKTSYKGWFELELEKSDSRCIKRAGPKNG